MKPLWHGRPAREHTAETAVPQNIKTDSEVVTYP